MTTAWVLLEFANAISASRARERFERVLVRLRSEPDAKIIALICLIVAASFTFRGQTRNGRSRTVFRLL